MTEVYFEDIYNSIISNIETAKDSLKICVAWFTDIEIYQSVLKAINKGVKTSIIVANHEFNRSSKVDFKELLMNNGYVGYIGNITDGSRDKLMHNKFCIIDDKIVITGSYNWTYKARFNDENIIVIKDQPLATNKFIAKFNEIKPKYGFALEGNEVKLFPIEEIMKKWEKKPSTASTTTKRTKIKRLAQNIFDKF